MADAYIGEIRLFAGTFAPTGWAFCNGQEMLIQQYTALYSILGLRYGGNGQTTFKLPDLRNRVPIHQGTGTGLTPRQVGSVGGSSTVTLIEPEMPSHTHVPNSVSTSTGSVPAGAVWSNSSIGRLAANAYSGTPTTTMNPTAIAPQGGSQPHNNMQPYQMLNFIICLTDGEYPVRSS